MMKKQISLLVLIVIALTAGAMVLGDNKAASDNLGDSGNPGDSSFQDNDEGERGTGYIPEDVVYPEQPVKVAELDDVDVRTIDDKQAYPFVDVCEALGYEVTYSDGVYQVKKDGETRSIDTKGNADFVEDDGVAFATGPLFNRLFGVGFRYYASTDSLGVFK